MKQYTLSFAESLNHTPEHPERTGISLSQNGFDVSYKVWNTPKALDKFLDRQNKKPWKNGNFFKYSETGYAKQGTYFKEVIDLIDNMEVY